jgi:hypothetical protein
VGCTKKEVLTLADKISGKYIGQFKYLSTEENHEILITKLSQNRIQVTPIDGKHSSNFEVNLESIIIAKEEIIMLVFPANAFVSTGTFSVATGKFSYLLHLGGPDPNNKESFNGYKN